MKSRLLSHILFWLAYLLFETYVEFAWISSSFATTPALDRWLMALYGESSLLLAKIPLCYLAVKLVGQFSREPRRVVWIAFGAIIGFGIAVTIHRTLSLHLILPVFYHEPPGEERIFDLKRVISSSLDILFVVGVFIAVKQYRLYQASREKEKGLMREKLEAELRFLRGQTNPHFLFNTLNNIYALARKKADETPEVVMKLSKLLRFMLYESGSDTIRISEELRVMNDYIELEQIRYQERLTISFQKSIDDESQPIAPLILLPFVENAFKHGTSETRFESHIHIDVNLIAGRLIFIIENSKDDDAEKGMLENIGLRNVRRQLELMYPDHRLEIENGQGLFKVRLEINLSVHGAI